SSWKIRSQFLRNFASKFLPKVYTPTLLRSNNQRFIRRRHCSLAIFSDVINIQGLLTSAGSFLLVRIKMEMEQESEWNAAQNISISEDLVTAAKHQLQFLAVVDRNRWLYESQCLQWAIYRYNACWLPLVAKHSESRVTEGPLVVPLDCEWVWHCHRLNPVRYKSDCEEFYGRILDNCNVVSSVQGISSRDTEEIWSKLYPNEPYDFDLARPSSSEFSETVYGTQSFSKYNFILAIERQSPFFYQLHPASYCNDLVELLGNVLEHDDTDQNRGKGQKLDTGFSETTKQWEETFGSRYWRAGAMYRGIAPSPITTTPCIPEIASNKADSTNELERLIDIPKTNYIEILLQCVEIKNLPEIHKGKVGVLFSKAQPDGIFNVKRKLSIQSELGQKQVAVFQCQPMGYLFFELVSQSKKTKTLGSCFISMEELSGPVSKLSVEKWLDVVPSSGTVGSEPIQLRVAASCTLPTPAPHVVQMLRSSPLSKTHCFFPLCGMVRFTRSWTRIIDAAGYEIIRLQMRENKKSAKEIFGLTRTGETLVLAQFLGKECYKKNGLHCLEYCRPI
ncbi:Protein of unknown function DUF1399, partial [Cynara cardunculus var. scolymus]